jgi:hypothetical protein
VVHFEGRLKRLVRYDPPKSTKLDGLKDQYEGWMFDPDNYGANPVCVVFTHLPSGLEPGDKLNVHGAFDGYFFKRYRYKAGDGWRDAPLLIGHTLVLRQPARQSSEDEGTFSGLLMSSAWVLIIGTIVVGVALFWWYRRNDRVLQDRLAAANPPTFSEPPAGPESHSREEEETTERPWFES